jgi:hypothetical protein
MVMLKVKARELKIGTKIPVQVTQEAINHSIPCQKGKCMLTLAAMVMLEALFGDKVSKVKSTNHGITFDVGGYRFLCVFDHRTSDLIFHYDKTYRATRSMAKARASVKPFTAKLMVESRSKIPARIPMSEETKKLLRTKTYTPKTGITTGSVSRQLSQ